MQLVERPVLFPGRTVTGRTTGPVVHAGRAIPAVPGKTQGVNVYLDERESRQLLVAWGWPTPEEYAQAERLNTELAAKVASLEADVEKLERAQTKVVPLSQVKKELSRA
jgi:hypothetical protein